MQRHVLAPAHPHAELQAVQAIETADTLAIHEPTFASQQHPDPLIAKPRSGMGQIANAQPECRLILGPTFSIPRCPAELG
jgi:hypothetical protein